MPNKIYVNTCIMMLTYTKMDADNSIYLFLFYILFIYFFLNYFFILYKFYYTIFIPAVIQGWARPR